MISSVYHLGRDSSRKYMSHQSCSSCCPLTRWTFDFYIVGWLPSVSSSSPVLSCISDRSPGRSIWGRWGEWWGAQWWGLQSILSRYRVCREGTHHCDWPIHPEQHQQSVEWRALGIQGKGSRLLLNFYNQIFIFLILWSITGLIYLTYWGKIKYPCEHEATFNTFHEFHPPSSDFLPHSLPSSDRRWRRDTSHSQQSRRPGRPCRTGRTSGWRSSRGWSCCWCGRGTSLSRAQVNTGRLRREEGVFTLELNFLHFPLLCPLTTTRNSSPLPTSN